MDSSAGKPPSQNSSSIRNIVHLVQSGKLKSADILQSSEKVFHDDEDRKSETSHNSSKLTSESRWILIKQLAQKKAQRQEGGIDSHSFSGSEARAEPPPGAASYVGPATAAVLAPAYREYTPNSYYDLNSPHIHTDEGDWVEDADSPLDQSPHSQLQRRPEQRASDMSPNRRSTDDHSYIEDARSYRIAQNEAALRDEVYRECTFQPRLYTSDVSRSRNKDLETPFYARVTRWQAIKDSEATRRRQSTSRVESESCTFKPKINRNSSRAAMELRNNTSVSDSLQNYSEDVATRLHRSYEESLTLKAKYIEAELKRHQEEELQDCTFQPDISRTASSKFSAVKPKYLLEETFKQNRPPAEDPAAKECTFTPRVKGVSSRMASAKLYVETNVVDRLSRPLPPAAAISGNSSARSTSKFDVTYGGDREVMDINSYLGSQRGGGSGMVTPSGSIFRSSFSHESGGSRRRASSAPRERVAGPSTPVLSKEEKEAKKKQFQEFLVRQTASEVKKKVRLENTMRSSTPLFKPDLDRKSLEIAKESHQGDFLDRMEKFLLKKVDGEQRRQSMTALADSGCTFAPQLSKKSEKMRARSTHEMSRGDQIRHENNVKMIAGRREQEEQESLTFKPKISKVGAKKTSVLKLAEDPSSHLTWVKTKQTRKEQERLEVQKAKEQKEVEECSFTPSTKKCPAYIVRIADSMKMINKVRESTEAPPVTNSKPAWKFT